METKNILADEMHIRRPILLEHLWFAAVAHARKVPRQRIEPNVKDMSFVLWYRDPPAEGSPADTYVLESSFDEADHFIHSRAREHELRVVGVEVQQFFLKSRQLEKVALFRHELGGTATVRTRLFPFRNIRFAANAVVALVLPGIDEAVLLYLLEDVGYGLMMAVLRGANKFVEADAQRSPGLLELASKGVD